MYIYTYIYVPCLVRGTSYSVPCMPVRTSYLTFPTGQSSCCDGGQKKSHSGRLASVLQVHYTTTMYMYASLILISIVDDYEGTRQRATHARTHSCGVHSHLMCIICAMYLYHIYVYMHAHSCARLLRAPRACSGSRQEYRYSHSKCHVDYWYQDRFITSPCKHRRANSK